MRFALTALTFTLALLNSGVAGLRAGEKSDAAAAELKKFQGTWTFDSVVAGGEKAPPEKFEGLTVAFDGEKYAVKMGDQVLESATMKLDPSKSPKTMDVTVGDGPNKGAVYLCIYELEGDTLKVCFESDGKTRPTKFDGSTGTQTLVVHKRVKK